MTIPSFLRCVVSLSVTLLFAALTAGAQTQRPVLVTGPDDGHSPEVRVLHQAPTGTYSSCVIQAYPPNFTGGVRVATGDVDGDGRAEIITGSGPGAGPHVRIFNSDTCRPLQGGQRDFLAYRANFR